VSLGHVKRVRAVEHLASNRRALGCRAPDQVGRRAKFEVIRADNMRSSRPENICQMDKKVAPGPVENGRFTPPDF
jgi:hypothetical protein